jgi:hypothetical protein
MRGARRGVSFVAPLLGRKKETIREECSFLVFEWENKRAVAFFGARFVFSEP